MTSQRMLVQAAAPDLYTRRVVPSDDELPVSSGRCPQSGRPGASEPERKRTVVGEEQRRRGGSIRRCDEDGSSDRCDGIEVVDIGGLEGERRALA